MTKKKTLADLTWHLFLVGGSNKWISEYTGIPLSKVQTSRRLYNMSKGSECMSHSGKADQIIRVLGNRSNLSIYETCAELGQTGRLGHCSQAYGKYGNVVSKVTKDGCIVDVTKNTVESGATFDVVDADTYSAVATARVIVDGGLMHLLKPRGHLFLTWTGLRNLKKFWPLDLLVYFGTTNPTTEDFNRLVFQTALKAGHVVRLVNSEQFDATLRQAWEVVDQRPQRKWCTSEQTKQVLRELEFNAA